MEGRTWFRHDAVRLRAQHGAAPAGGGMRDSQHGGQDDRAGGGLAALARTVVARLIAREGGSGRLVDAATVASIARAVVDPDRDPMDALRQDLRRSRISETDLVDTYFPEVARLLGCAWADDNAPFTDVTIGVARMQSMLRELGRDWTSNVAAEQDSATVLIVLPDGEQHSFGAMLLAGQLRRQGISVRLEVGASTATLRKLVHDRSFDCAMVSVACEEKLDQCKEVVKALKQGSHGRLWVAVGGPLLDRPIDVLGKTGADIVTCDPLLALQGALTEQAQVKEVTG
jgi:MerR family transcriptional regulator, light-induced transcriptional regulator